MKRIIVTGAIAAIAAVSFAGTASAAPAAPNENACFGQVHKDVNGGLLADAKINNVGDLVKSPLVEIDGAKKGQGKKALASSLCP